MALCFAGGMVFVLRGDADGPPRVAFAS
jgi:hypothetical protein